MLSVVVGVVLATAPAMSGLVEEVGVGVVVFPPTPAAEAALGYHHEFTRGGGLEVRVRGGLRLNIPTFRPDGFFTGTVHYVTPRIPLKDHALTFGFGAGGAFFSGCLGSDICAPLGGGPIIELTHRLLFPRGPRTQFFMAVNFSAAWLVNAVIPLAFTGGFGVGWLMDLRAWR